MKLIVCGSCDAEFSVRHSMDEIYFEILCCPFCGAGLSDNLEDLEDAIEDWDENE